MITGSIVAAVLFAIAAVIGLVLAWRHLGMRAPSLWAALAHGVFAAAGVIVLLTIVVRAAGVPAVRTTSLAFFLDTVPFGVFLFATHVHARRLPAWIIVLHRLMAVVGFVLLLVFLR